MFFASACAVSLTSLNMSNLIIIEPHQILFSFPEKTVCECGGSK